MGESEPTAERQAGAELDIASALANALPGTIKEVREIQSLVRIGKLVRVYDVVVESHDRETRRTLVAKEHPSATSATASFAQLKRLRDHGFAPPSRWQVPEPIAVAGRCLIEAELPGTPWIRDSSDRAAVSAAEWLLALQRTALVAAFKRPKELRAPHERWSDVATTLNRELRGDVDEPKPSHGDFHPKNVRLGDGYVGVLDLEDLGLREPAVDVGDAIAQLLIMTDVEDHPADGRRAARAFWNRYRREGPATDRRASVQTARALLETIDYKLALARAEGEQEPAHEHFADLAERFLGAGDPNLVLG